jgi:hypothetical protein
MDWMVWDSNPGGARFSTPIQTSPGAHPPFYAVSAEVRAIPLLSLWVIVDLN